MDHDHDEEHEMMEEEAEGGASTGSSQGGSTRRATRSYECTFCKRGFSNAQALGGHMNIHRKDKAKLKHNNNYSTTTSSSSNEAVGYPNLAMINPTNTWSWVVNDSTHDHDYYPTSNYNYNYIVPTAAQHQVLLPSLFVPQPAAGSLANYDHQFGHTAGDHRRSSRRSSDGATTELDLELRLGTMDPHHHHHHHRHHRHRHQPDPPIESSSTTILGTRKFF